MLTLKAATLVSHLEALEYHLHGVVGRHHWGEKREGETLEKKSWRKATRIKG